MPTNVDGISVKLVRNVIEHAARILLGTTPITLAKAFEFR